MDVTLPLRTERLLLREQTLADAEAAHSYECMPDVVRYTTHDCRSLAESRAVIERSVAAQSWVRSPPAAPLRTMSTSVPGA